MELNLSETYGTAHRIYNNNPSNSPLRVEQEKSINTTSATVQSTSTSTLTNNLQHQISNDKDIKAIVNDESLLSNEDALKKKLLENVLEELQGNKVSIHPNNISLKSASFDYSQKDHSSDSYTQYGGIYSTENDKAIGHIYSHYKAIEEETSFAMKMEFTVKTPNEEFNISINISHTQSFKKELYEENLRFKEQVSEDKSVLYHHDKESSTQIKNNKLALNDIENAYLKEENQTYYERLSTSKGDNYTDITINSKESSLELLKKETYKNGVENDTLRPVINFDKDIEDKSQFENMNLIFDAQPYEPLSLRNNNGFLESFDSGSIKPKEKPLYLKIWEENQEKEKTEKLKEEEIIKQEKLEEKRELLALFQEDLGFIYLSSFSKQSEEFTISNEMQEVSFVKDEQGQPSILNKTDISV